MIFSVDSYFGINFSTEKVFWMIYIPEKGYQPPAARRLRNMTIAPHGTAEHGQGKGGG